MGIDRSRGREAVVAPHLVQKLLARIDAVRVFAEELEQFELHFSRFDGHAVMQDQALRWIQLEGPRDHSNSVAGIRMPARARPELDSDARHELAGLEWLRNV